MVENDSAGCILSSTLHGRPGGKIASAMPSMHVGMLCWTHGPHPTHRTAVCVRYRDGVAGKAQSKRCLAKWLCECQGHIHGSVVICAFHMFTSYLHMAQSLGHDRFRFRVCACCCDPGLKLMCVSAVFTPDPLGITCVTCILPMLLDDLGA